MSNEPVGHSRLDSIRDWEERAERAVYHVCALAADCRVSPRQLQRFIRRRFGKSPREWLTELRLARAAAQLQQHALVKEAAAVAGLTAAAFTHRLTRQYGLPPTAFRATSGSPNPDVRLAQPP